MIDYRRVSPCHRHVGLPLQSDSHPSHTCDSFTQPGVPRRRDLYCCTSVRPSVDLVLFVSGCQCERTSVCVIARAYVYLNVCAGASASVDVSWSVPATAMRVREVRLRARVTDSGRASVVPACRYRVRSCRVVGPTGVVYHPTRRRGQTRPDATRPVATSHAHTHTPSKCLFVASFSAAESVHPEPHLCVCVCKTALTCALLLCSTGRPALTSVVSSDPGKYRLKPNKKHTHTHHKTN